MKRGDAEALALRLNMDTSELMNIFTRSMGNYKEIRSFLYDVPDSLKQVAVSLLKILPDKDLRDTKGYILSDHLKNTLRPAGLVGEQGTNMFLNYILNPRVANEIIADWRSYFREKLPSQLIAMASADPLVIVQYLDKNIVIANDENYYKTPLTPKGVNELKVADNDSRSICFVAICRTLGIPSRLEPGSNIPQYFFNNCWNDIFFADQKQPSQKKGFLRLHSFETKPIPEYYVHFTIARFDNGRFNTLEYDNNKKISDFTEELPLIPGYYMLVTGNRLNDSKILSNISFFEISENEHKTIEVKIRKDISDNKLLGTINLNKVIDLFDNIKIDPERVTCKGVTILWIDPEICKIIL
jgi:hypothetical protein